MLQCRKGQVTSDLLTKVKVTEKKILYGSKIMLGERAKQASPEMVCSCYENGGRKVIPE